MLVVVCGWFRFTLEQSRKEKSPMRPVSLHSQTLLLLIGPALAIGLVFSGARAGDAPSGNASTLRAAYYEAGRDLDLKERIIDEVISEGQEASASFLLLVRRDMDDRVNAYGRAFTHQLGRSKEETVDAVLASSDTLPNVRQQIVRLGHKAEQLAEAAGTTLQEEQSFDEYLAASESGAVLDVFRARLEDAVNAYGRDFTRQINVSQEETVDAVLASSETLPVTREETVRLGHMAEQLADAAGTTLYEDQSFDEYLVGLEGFAVREVLLGEVFAKLDDEEIAAYHATNAARKENGLAPLEIDFQLVLTGRDHSNDMRTHDFFDHTSPLEGKSSPFDRARLFDTTAAGENIYMGSSSGDDAVVAWMNSPGHRENILTASFKRVGIGRSNGHWTQLFGR